MNAQEALEMQKKAVENYHKVLNDQYPLDETDSDIFDRIKEAAQNRLRKVHFVGRLSSDRVSNFEKNLGFFVEFSFVDNSKIRREFPSFTREFPDRWETIISW